MKAQVASHIEKLVSNHCHKGRGTVMHRLVHSLFHDWIPTLVIFSLVAWGAMIMTEHIYLARLSRSAVLAKASSSMEPLQKEVHIPGISLPLHQH